MSLDTDYNDFWYAPSDMRLCKEVTMKKGKKSYRNVVEAPSTQMRDPETRVVALRDRVMRFVKFASSSLICTALDQVVAGVLFVVLRGPMQGMGFLRILVGTVIARCISQALNYALNHRLVFNAKGNTEQRRPSRRESLPRFLVVAVGILTLSTIGVYLLHRYAGMQESVAKVVMDAALFFLNYALQRTWVFGSEVSVPASKVRRRKRKKHNSSPGSPADEE